MEHPSWPGRSTLQPEEPARCLAAGYLPSTPCRVRKRGIYPTPTPELQVWVPREVLQNTGTECVCPWSTIRPEIGEKTRTPPRHLIYLSRQIGCCWKMLQAFLFMSAWITRIKPYCRQALTAGIEDSFLHRGLVYVPMLGAVQAAIKPTLYFSDSGMQRGAISHRSTRSSRLPYWGGVLSPTPTDPYRLEVR